MTIRIPKEVFFYLYTGEGGLGNLLTMVALPYIRHKYRVQFSLLSHNIIVLILHLSATDLLNIAIVVSHKAQVS